MFCGRTGGGDPRGLGPSNSVWVTDPIRGTVLGFTGNDADGYGLLGAELLPATDLSDGFTWSFWAKSDQANNNDIILGSRYNTNNVDFSLEVEGVPRQWAKFTGNQFEWRPNDVAGESQLCGYWGADRVDASSGGTRWQCDALLSQWRADPDQLPESAAEFPMPIYIGGQGRRIGEATSMK